MNDHRAAFDRAMEKFTSDWTDVLLAMNRGVPIGMEYQPHHTGGGCMALVSWVVVPHHVPETDEWPEARVLVTTSDAIGECDAMAFGEKPGDYYYLVFGGYIDDDDYSIEWSEEITAGHFVDQFGLVYVPHDSPRLDDVSTACVRQVQQAYKERRKA